MNSALLYVTEVVMNIHENYPSRRRRPRVFLITRRKVSQQKGNFLPRPLIPSAQRDDADRVNLCYIESTRHQDI